MAVKVKEFAEIIMKRLHPLPVDRIRVLIDEQVYRNGYGYALRPLSVLAYGNKISHKVKFTELMKLFDNKCPYILVSESRNRRIYSEGMILTIETLELREYEGFEYYDNYITPIIQKKDKKIYSIIQPAINEKLKQMHQTEEEEETEINIDDYI